MNQSELQSFLTFALECLESCHSQNVQDLWGLWENLDHLNDGFFVEFGAMGGIIVSNSYLLERLGWAGIVAEPQPQYSEALEKNRNCHKSFKAIYSVSDENVFFKMYKDMPARATIADYEREDEVFKNKNIFSEIIVNTLSLNDLLKIFNAPKDIHFLSIDTEGTEYEILRTFDFDTYNVRSLCVEYGTSENRELIFNLLSSKGFKRKFVAISAHDDWYVREDLALHSETKLRLREGAVKRIKFMDTDINKRFKLESKQKITQLLEHRQQSS